MKIRKVRADLRKREFLLQTTKGDTYAFPFARVSPEPARGERFEALYVDPELGGEAFTYELSSGGEGSVHLEQVLEYSRDPAYFAELLTYRLTLTARAAVEESGLSRRYLARRLNTSVPQLYRLLDPANTGKSLQQLIALLHLLNREVDVVIKPTKPSATYDSTRLIKPGAIDN